MAKKLPKTTARHGHRMTKAGAIKVTTTRKPKGASGKITDKILKAFGK